MEEILAEIARALALAISAMAVAIVAYGAADAFVRLIRSGLSRTTTHGDRKAVWQRFGVWLLLGLEFELAADIIGTVISPTWADIGELAAIAVIRTFLNYFLEKDVERSLEEPAAAAVAR